MSREKRKEVRRDLWRAQDKKCFYCGEEISYKHTTSDHVFPESAGFSLKGNHIAACQTCNVKKGDTFPDSETILRVQELYKKMGRIFFPVLRVEFKDFLNPYNVFASVGVEPKNLPYLTGKEYFSLVESVECPYNGGIMDGTWRTEHDGQATD